jgi:molybdopterin molybdotransferase
MPAPLMPDDRLSTVDEHVDRIVEALAPLPPYDQPLLESLNLPVCESIVAPMDLPSFDNSAMDGYAVYHADVVSASEDHPVHLPVVGELAAGGQSTFFALSPGTTVRIMTGAPVPQGADAIVPVEWTDGGVATVRITRAPRPDQHVRHAGEDVQTGDVLLEDGSILGPRQLGLLASVGRSQVRSRPRPRLVIMSTGAELREPGTPLGHDSIYDANSYMLAAAARSAGAIAYRVGIVSDDPADFADALSDQLVRADLVVTSGGVSKGAYDVVKEVLSELGTVSFGEVAMQPGKPQGFGFVGEDATPIITLPGNPVSSYVSFEVFVVPAIRRMMGRLPYRRPLVRAVSATSFSSAPERQQYVRARFELDASGPSVTPVGGHGSHLMGDLSEANALVVVPAATTAVRAGDQVQVLVLDRDF